MRVREFIPMIAVGVVGNSVIYLMPILVGAMVSYRGLSEKQAGFMASAEIAGYSVATFAAAVALDRFKWRHMALAGAAMMVSANLAASLDLGRELFGIMRFVSGLGGGLLAAIATVSLGRSDKPDRNYGVLFAALLLFATAGFWVLPSLMEGSGLKGAYRVFSALGLVGAVAALLLPKTGRVRAGSTGAAASHTWLLSGVVLCSIFIFWAQQYAVWAYIERIGNGAGLASRFIGFSLGIATLTGFAGAALVAWAGTKFGRIMPLGLVTGIALACLVPLAGHLSAASYLASTAVIALAWNVVNPFQLGILAEVDSSGKALALAATVQGVGMAVGPTMAALTIVGNDFSTMIVWAGVMTLLSYAFMLPSLLAIRRGIPQAG